MEDAVGLHALSAELRLAGADDGEVVQACMRGESEAYRELLARYRKPTLALAYQMLGNAEDAEDIAQEAFIRVFEAIHGFRGQAAFSTWLYRIVTNLCLGQLRGRHPVVPLDAIGDPSCPETASRRVPETLVTRQVLAQMAPDLRAILLLREQGALSYGEIATALGLPMGTVRSRLSKARAAFRAAWRQLHEGQGSGK
jgi:RNA polymerase sigma-70 factor (ECF subfamily)